MKLKAEALVGQKPPRFKELSPNFKGIRHQVRLRFENLNLQPKFGALYPGQA